MRIALAVLVVIFLLVTVMRGCAKKETGPPRIKTYPVSGKIHIDGAPPAKDPKKEYESGIQVSCFPVSTQDPNFPTSTSAEASLDGEFKLSTYETGDGVPEGEYALTFAWQQFNLMSRSFGGPDALKGKYNDPKKPVFKLFVKDGQPIKVTGPDGDMQEPFVFELKTK